MALSLKSIGSAIKTGLSKVSGVVNKARAAQQPTTVPKNLNVAGVNVGKLSSLAPAINKTNSMSGKTISSPSMPKDLNVAGVNIGKIANSVNPVKKATDFNLKNMGIGGSSRSPMSPERADKIARGRMDPLTYYGGKLYDKATDKMAEWMSPEAALAQTEEKPLGVPSENATTTINTPTTTTATSGATIGGTPSTSADIKAKYNATYTGGVPSGTNLDNRGMAMGAVQGALPKENNVPGKQGGTTLLDSVMAGDGGIGGDWYSQMMKEYQNFYSPKNQQTSLLDQYNKLVKSSGIGEINEQLLNYSKIINGTEDDIRTEVTKAGGFATDSQVMAMTNARNKVLISNYNNLLQTKQMITENIDKMMQYSQADRQYATQQFESRMNFQFKAMEMGRQAQQFAANQLQTIANKVGYQGLMQMTGNDRNAIGRIERVLGMSSGGLAALASIPDPEREMMNLEMQLKREQISTERAQRASLSEGGGGGMGMVSPVVEQYAQLINDGTYSPNDVPKEIKTQVAERVNQLKASADIYQTDMGLDLTGDLLNDPNLNKVTGVLIGPIIPGTPQQATKAKFNQLRDMITLKNREKLRGQGTITDKETDMLARASTALNSNLSAEDAREQIRIIETVFNNSKAKALARVGSSYTPSPYQQYAEPSGGTQRAYAAGSNNMRSQVISAGYDYDKMLADGFSEVEIKKALGI